MGWRGKAGSPDSGRRLDVIKLRLSEAEDEELARHAGKAGTPKAVWVREVVTGRLPHPNFAVPPPSQPAALPAPVLSLVAMPHPAPAATAAASRPPPLVPRDQVPMREAGERLHRAPAPKPPLWNDLPDPPARETASVRLPPQEARRDPPPAAHRAPPPASVPANWVPRAAVTVPVRITPPASPTPDLTLLDFLRELWLSILQLATTLARFTRDAFDLCAEALRAAPRGIFLLGLGLLAFSVVYAVFNVPSDAWRHALEWHVAGLVGPGHKMLIYTEVGPIPMLHEDIRAASSFIRAARSVEIGLWAGACWGVASLTMLSLGWTVWVVGAPIAPRVWLFVRLSLPW